MFGLAATALAGWLAGAAGNWAADRLPCARGEQDAAQDAIPFFTARWPLHYLTFPWRLLGRAACPHCGRPRPLRAPLLELATMAAFVAAWCRFRADPLHVAVICLYAAILLVVLVIDLEHRLVPNVVLAPAAVLALAASFLPAAPTPLEALAGGAAGLGLFLVIALIGRGKMGWGDVKLAGVIGLMTGYPAALTALVLGILLGGVIALVLLISRRAGRRSTMAYAPNLALAALVVLLFAAG